MDANRQLPIGARHKSSRRLLLENELKVNKRGQLPFGHAYLRISTLIRLSLSGVSETSIFLNSPVVPALPPLRTRCRARFARTVVRRVVAAVQLFILISGRKENSCLGSTSPVASRRRTVPTAKSAIAALKITPTTNTAQPGTTPTVALSMNASKSRAGNGCKYTFRFQLNASSANIHR